MVCVCRRLLLLSCSLHFFVMFFFFKQKTAYEMRISDWSSDVCSSDLTVRRSRIVPVRAVHQYSSQLPSRFQGSKTISPGTFARREDDRGDRPLCDGGSR